MPVPVQLPVLFPVLFPVCPRGGCSPDPPWQVLLFVLAARGFITAGNTQVFFLCLP